VGLGGYLTWTAVAREVHQKFNDPELRILPCEAQGGKITKVVESDVFKNNPFFYNKENNAPIFPLQLNNPATNYCKEDRATQAIHRFDKHITEQICEFYNIFEPQLKCDLFFSDKENEKRDSLLKEVSKEFVIIEPTSKTNYTPNRVYPFEKWQNVVNMLSKHIEVVQVGTDSNKLLNNVTNFIGKTTFREASNLIGKSKLLLSSEGGLTHAATAVETVALVILTGYQSKNMICYPQNIYIDVATHGPCGLKVVCKQCAKDAQRHNENEIVEKALNYLE